MRQKLLNEGAKELSYEIREIVKKADQLKQLGLEITWENIGDPIQKKAQVPIWMKEIIASLVMDNNSYSYCHSKGILATRKFLAQMNNKRSGAQITEEDVLFFNGTGDAIAKIYQYLDMTSRVIGPSPAYSTHSSAEAAHAHQEPLTYRLDPDNHWYPDLDDLYNKIKYNPNVVGILIINPDNPTGMVYPYETLKRIVEIAREFKLMLISDEIYMNITYNGVQAYSLAEIIEDIPGIAIKGISKEFPWPGSRCGWMEFYNRDKDQHFNKLCIAMENAKMLEVCSTTLPQLAIPKIMGDERYMPYRLAANKAVGKRSQHISQILGSIPELRFNETNGAFYNTIIFKDGVLTKNQTLPIQDSKIESLVTSWTNDPNMNLDKRFVYYLLGATGICVVPISSFCSQLQGFRVTLLEENEENLVKVFTQIKEAVVTYIHSVKEVAYID